MMINESLGYYLVNGKKFESKIHALIHATESKKSVKWIFNNKLFDNYNWSTEPEETLDQLYAQRARSLREKYDYLILCYSGGSDSNNVLETFLRNNIFLDEVTTNFIIDAAKPVTNEDISSTKADNHNAEWDLLTKHRIKYINEKSPNTRISNFDMSKPILENFKNNIDGSWVLNCKEWINPISPSRYNVIHNKDLRMRFDKSKKIGIILGVDKPQLVIRDNKLFLYFIDTTANITPMTSHIKDYDNSTVEFFYWSPDSVRILCKQGHTMLKWLKGNPQFQSIWDWSTGLPSSPLYKSARNIKEQLLRGIVYSTWNYNWFQAEKGTIGWTNVNDRWFFDYFKDTPEFTGWSNGIKYVLNSISDDFMMTVHGKEMERFKPINSNNYFIGHLNDNLI